MERIRSLPPVRLEALTNRDLLDYFKNTWELYELLFSAIERDDSLYLNPDPLRHPLIFYLGHTAVFYINKLKLAGLIGSGFASPADQPPTGQYIPHRQNDNPQVPEITRKTEIIDSHF